MTRSKKADKGAAKSEGGQQVAKAVQVQAPKPRFYAVRVGRTPGLFTSSAEFEASIVGFKGAMGKLFKDEDAAKAWLAGEVPTPAAAPAATPAAAAAAAAAPAAALAAAPAAALAAAPATAPAAAPVAAPMAAPVAAPARKMTAKSQPPKKKAAVPIETETEVAVGRRRGYSEDSSDPYEYAGGGGTPNSDTEV